MYWYDLAVEACQDGVLSFLLFTMLIITVTDWPVRTRYWSQSFGIHIIRSQSSSLMVRTTNKNTASSILELFYSYIISIKLTKLVKNLIKPISRFSSCRSALLYYADVYLLDVNEFLPNKLDHLQNLCVPIITYLFI